MHMATPIGTLTTNTNPGSKYFDAAREAKYDQTVAQIDSGALVNYAYALTPGSTILDTLLSPSVKVTRVQQVKAASGEPVVQIDFEETARHQGRTGRWKSQLVLSPEQGWGLTAFSRTTGQGSEQVTYRVRVAYAGMTEGVPLVGQIETETLQGQQARTIRREGIEVTEFLLGDPDDYYFTSFAF
jgi:hypothetical protein